VSFAGEQWIRVEFAGAWPPSSSFYSWFSKVSLNFVAGGAGTFTTEHHLPSTPSDYQFTGGSLAAADVGYVEEANGYLLVFASGLAEIAQVAAVESGLQKEPPTAGVFASDNASIFVFNKTVRAW
jgi:hypothetical protein